MSMAFQEPVYGSRCEMSNGWLKRRECAGVSPCIALERWIKKAGMGRVAEVIPQMTSELRMTKLHFKDCFQWFKKEEITAASLVGGHDPPPSCPPHTVSMVTKLPLLMPLLPRSCKAKSCCVILPYFKSHSEKLISRASLHPVQH